MRRYYGVVSVVCKISDFVSVAPSRFQSVILKRLKVLTGDSSGGGQATCALSDTILLIEHVTPGSTF